MDNKEYCLINGQFDRFLKSQGLTRPQYVEQYEKIVCRCKYCGALAQIKSGLTPVDTCGSKECAKKARAAAISNTNPAIRKQWNAAPAERRRTDKEHAAKINAATHAGNLVVGEDGLTGYERTAKKRRETLLAKHGNACWANTEKTKQTWANKSDEEKDKYAMETSIRQKAFPTEKRKEITDRIGKQHLEKYGTICPANRNNRGYSKIGVSLFEKLDSADAIFKPKTSSEKLIGRSCVDFCVGQKVIEVFGDYWHANPAVYVADYNNARKKMRAVEIWAADAERIKKIEEAGYQVKIVWERDYKRNPARVIQECKEWLSST